MTRYEGRHLADPYLSGRLDGLREALAIVRALRKSQSRDWAERKIEGLIKKSIVGGVRCSEDD